MGGRTVKVVDVPPGINTGMVWYGHATRRAFQYGNLDLGLGTIQY